MRLLGIDPGLARLGWAVLEHSGDGEGFSSPRYGVIETNKDTPLPQRLFILAREIDGVIKKERPQVALMEELYFFKNVRSAIHVAQAQGAVLSLLSKKNLPVVFYTPLQIKQAVSGDGRADKAGVIRMVEYILGLSQELKKPRAEDAMDALALCICHIHHHGYDHSSH